MELFKLFGTIAVENEEANREIDETTGKAEQSEGRMSSAFKKIGAAVATYLAVDKIVEFGKSITNAAAEVAAEQSAFEQIMGEYSNTAQEKINQIADTTGMVSTRLTPYMTSMTAKFKGLGFDIDDATTLAQDGLTLAADAAAFWDKSLEDSMSGLNSFINGSYEGGEAIGLFANDTQLASYAVKQGIVGETKEWANLDEARKQATRLQYAQDMMKLSGATGQAAKEADQYANVQANLTEKWRQFKAQIGEPLLQNVVLPAMSKLSDVVDLASEKFPVFKKAVSDAGSYLVSTFSPALDSVKSLFGSVKDAVQPLVQGFINFVSQASGGASATEVLAGGLERLSTGVQVVVGMLQQFVEWVSGGSTGAEAFRAVVVGVTAAYIAFRTALAVQSAWTGLIGMIGKAKVAFAGLSATMLANPIALVIAAIAGLAAGFIYLWNNCEGFRNFFIGMWEGIKSAASATWDFIKSAADLAIESLVSGWNSFVSFFTGLWVSVTSFLSTAWQTIQNVISVGVQMIGQIISAAVQLITLPWQFIWQNCSQYIIAAWDSIKSTVSNAVNAVKNAILVAFDFIKNSIIVPYINFYKNVISTGWNAIKTVVSTVLNAINSAVTSAFNYIKNSVITPVMNGIRSVISSVWSAISSVVSSIMSTISSTISNAWLAVKSTVSNAINGVKSTISSGLNSASNTVSNILNSIKNKFSSILNGAADIVKGAINKIKGFFNFSWSLPKLKLPHVKISGKFSLMPPSVPKFGIEWYKKGGVMEDPTLFGINQITGKAMVGGEAGPEAIAPIDVLQGYVRAAVREENGEVAERVERLISILEKYFPLILAQMAKDIYLDSGELVGSLGVKIDAELGDIAALRRRGQ